MTTGNQTSSSMSVRRISLVIFFISVGFVFGSPNLGFGESVKVAAFRSYVSDALSNIQNHSNLLITASHSLWDADSGKTEVRDISYLISGGNYRTKIQWATSNLNNIKEYQISYNGEKFASFQGNIEQIIHGKLDPEYDPYVPINPITAHLIFLSRDGDACPGCIIRVKDVVAGEASKVLEKNQITEDTATSTPEGESFIFPSDKTGGLSSYWKIQFIKAGSVGEIASVTKLIGAGDFKATYKFSDYTNIAYEDGHLSFPRLITMEAYTGNHLFKTETTKVMTVQINPPIPENAFDIAKDLDSRAKRVLNANSQVYERLPSKNDPQNVKYRTRRTVVWIVFGVLSIGMLWVLLKTTKPKV